MTVRKEQGLEKKKEKKKAKTEKGKEKKRRKGASFVLVSQVYSKFCLSFVRSLQ